MPQNIETNTNDKPIWGDVLVEVDRDGHMVWVRMAPVYAARKGSKGELEFELPLEPLAWRDPSFPRRLIIRKRSGRRKEES
jgi:hypothetical protein